MSDRWEITYSLLSGTPSYIDGDAVKWAQAFRKKKGSPGMLEVDGYTDQIDVFIRRSNGRRIRFLTFMAA